MAIAVRPVQGRATRKVPTARGLRVGMRGRFGAGDVGRRDARRLLRGVSRLGEGGGGEAGDGSIQKGERRVRLPDLTVQRGGKEKRTGRSGPCPIRAAAEKRDGHHTATKPGHAFIALRSSR